jgi:hypothetical protein
MGKNIDAIISKLPKSRQKKIQARAAEIARSLPKKRKKYANR